MEDSPLPPRPGGMTELEERLLAASVHKRLFTQPAEAATIGRYRVLDRLGQGAMGVVYSALDEQLDRRIAIKLLHAGRGQVHGEARERLRREALALGRLSHPNVVAIYEIGEARDQLFVAMELVEGVTLQAWLTERPRRVTEILAAYVQAGHGLAAAHAVGLVHRDFKPENVLIGRDGRVRVVDFGLARHAFDETTSHAVAPQHGRLDSALTATGALLGTPAYMAPEQAGTAVRVDARADQFSFCVALYEALYGERPFGGATLEAYVAAVAAGDVRPPTPGRRVPRQLRRALVRGLRSAPDERWPDMHALLATLTAQSRVWVPAVAALVVAFALGFAWWIVAPPRADEQGAREAVARARVDAFAGELTTMLAAHEVASAERRIADLVASPEVRSTEAAASLWLRWAELLAAQDRPSATAWAHTYARTRDAEVRRTALIGLARSFHRQRDTTGLAHALALISAEVPELAGTPEVRAMRFEVAAYHRDLAQALRLAPDAGPEALAIAPVLAALARGRPHLPPAAPYAALHHVRWRASPSKPVTPTLPGGERLSIDREGADLRLLDEAGHPLARWPNSGVTTAAIGADLDNDGELEVLVGLGNGTRGLHRLERGPNGVWQTPTALELAEPTSDVTGLAVADLDGDARPELVAALGPWRAYDIRVFRPTAEGTLRQVARRKLGIPLAVATLGTPHGPRIAVLIGHKEASPLTMPPDRPHGITPGIHLLRLDGDTLTLERSLPLARGNDDLRPERLLVADVDGDGLDDLVVAGSSAVRASTRARSLATIEIARQGADGSFRRVQIADLELIGADQLDDDPAIELVFKVDGVPWATGLATDASTPLPPSSLAAPPGVGHAPELAAAGAPPEVLALDRAGLSELALSALLDCARSAEPSARRRLHFVGATLAAEQRDRATARALLEDAADEPELRAAALGQLACDHEDRGDLTTAIHLLDQRSELLTQDPVQRAESADLRARLAGLEDSRQTLPLLFSRGERVPWSALSPAQVRADPVTRTLAVETASELPPAVVWPLRWDGRQLLVELELRIDALEWGSTLQLRLLGDTDTLAWRIGLGVTGGGGVNNLMLIHQSDDRSLEAVPLGPIPTDGEPRRLLLRIDGTSVGFRYLGAARDVVHEVARVNTRPYPAGDYRLELTADPRWNVPQARAQVTIDRLDLAGAELLLRPGPTGIEQAAALLVDGETHEAAALLELLASADPRARLWLAVALAELGAADRSAELLQQALTESHELERELIAWLRTRTVVVTPLVRRALGLARHLELVARAWANALTAGLGPGSTRALRSALAGIDEACAAGPRCATMRHALGRAHIAAFDLVRARRAFLGAMADDPPPAETGLIALDLAGIEATRGDGAAALTYARQALALAPAPEIVRDMLRARPELQTLLHDPAWQALLAIDDGLP